MKVNYGIIRNSKEYSEFINNNSNIISFAKELGNKMKASSDGTVYEEGFCVVCAKNVKFKSEMLLHHSSEPILSETLTCLECGCSNRIRAMFFVLHKLIGSKKNLDIYAYEQVTDFYKNLVNIYGAENRIIGSEYLGADLKSGSIKNGVRHEDAQNLSFKADSFDFLISNHVFEHVSNIDKTFSEAYRVLKNEGCLVFGIPFDDKKEKTNVRAKIENNQLILLDEKETHGNPVSNEGSLVFYNFGWDIYDKMHKAGFKDAYIVNVLDEKLANIVDYPTVTFVAKK